MYFHVDSQVCYDRCQQESAFISHHLELVIRNQQAEIMANQTATDTDFGVKQLI